MYGVWVAHQLGYNVGVLTKAAIKDKDGIKQFPIPRENITWVESKETTSIYNDYKTDDMERRVCTNQGQADPFLIEDFPEFSASVIQHEGLLAGEIDLGVIEFLAKKSVDFFLFVSCFESFKRVHRHPAIFYIILNILRCHTGKLSGLKICTNMY